MVVYPRWRGELAYRLVIAPPQLGLSPLARGTQYAFNHCQAYFRFIPAGAGNSVARWTLPDHQPVYPRWRGELTKLNDGRYSVDGLSPLARGTQ